MVEAILCLDATPKLSFPPLWTFTIIGLLFDLLGAIIVLAPDWRVLDDNLKYLGYKLSFLSFLPLVSYPIKNLDKAYRLEYIQETFIEDNQALRLGELGFETITDIVDSIDNIDEEYDVISHEGGIVTRVQSPVFQRDELGLENVWGTGTSLGGPHLDEVTEVINNEMSAIMFRIGGGFLALGFSIQIVVELLKNLL